MCSSENARNEEVHAAGKWSMSRSREPKSIASEKSKRMMRRHERLRSQLVAIVVASGLHIRRRLFLGRLESSPGDEADSDEDDHATVNAGADVAGLTAPT